MIDFLKACVWCEKEEGFFLLLLLFRFSFSKTMLVRLQGQWRCYKIHTKKKRSLWRVETANEPNQHELIKEINSMGRLVL